METGPARLRLIGRAISWNMFASMWFRTPMRTISTPSPLLVASRAWPLLLALLILVPCGARAQINDPRTSAAPDPTRWGFFFNLGIGDQTGDFADQLQKGTTGEFGLLREKSNMRYGLALSFGSWGMAAPYDHELEWGFQRIDVLAQRTFNPGGTFRPYLEGRFGVAWTPPAP